MDNLTFVEAVSNSAAKLDYATVHDMLQSCVDFKYTQQHILSDGLIKLIIAELEYWHSLADRLLKEKVSE